MRRNKESGQALIETALVMPVLILMVLAIFAFGHLFMSQQVVTNACREGARAGTLGKSAAEIQQTVAQYLNAANLQAAPQVDVQRAQGPAGTQVTVDVRYPLKLVVPVPGITTPKILAARTIMRIE